MPKAASASIAIHNMPRSFSLFALLSARPIRRILGSAPSLALTTLTASTIALVGCSTARAPGPRYAPPVPTEPGPAPHVKARWVHADWAELPGWDQDSILQAWPALLRSCARAAPEWTRACSSAYMLRTDDPQFEASAREWAQAMLQPYRVESLDGQTNGLLTGYYEPLLDARKQPDATYNVPLYAPPTDLQTRKPYWTRAELDTDPAARAALQGRELAYVADPIDAMSLQIQGSGRIRLLDSPGPDGAPRVVRLAFAGHNNQPYQSIGRWLIDQGQLGADQASWPSIRAWAKLHPERTAEMLRANPRVVFFKEEALPAPDVGPMGAQGVPLTPGRSIAVDKESIPYGTPVWLVSTEPQAWAPVDQAPLPRALQRLVVAQDTGGAIVGAVRADYFWGWGVEAETQAGRTKQPLRLWVLWPKS